VNSPNHDSVARIGSVDSLLDGLARPDDRALRSGGADRRRQYYPLATNRVRAMVVNKTMVRLIRRASFLVSGAG
jgi:hypothetical protein